MKTQTAKPIRVKIAVKVRGFKGCKSKKKKHGTPNSQLTGSLQGNHWATEAANGPVHVKIVNNTICLVGGQIIWVYLAAAI